MQALRHVFSAGLLLLVLINVGALPASSQVVPGSPFPTPAVNLAIPALPNASGPLFPAPVNQKGPDGVHEGIFTWGPDIVKPGFSTRKAWEDAILPDPPGSFLFTVSPTFLPHLDSQALAAAYQHRDELTPGGIGKAFELFKKLEEFDPDAKVQLTVPSSRTNAFFGYRPLRARWLRSQWGGPLPAVFQPEKKYVYADYSAFEDIRLRGGRLYCAAREAQLQEGGQTISLGERPGFSIKLLGHAIDFLVIEPTMALNGPQAFFGFPGTGDGGDGAQAFDIPFLLGTRVTPIRGLGLPGFGEARVPVDLVTGDTEVSTLAEKRPVFVGWVQKGFGLSPSFVTMHSKEYQTLTHADAVVSAGFSGANQFGADAEFTLFYAGPLRIVATLGLDYEVGAFDKSDDKRLLKGFPPPPDWPAGPRKGFLYANSVGQAPDIRYHDGPWALVRPRGSPLFQWQVQPEGKTDPFWTLPLLPTLRPHDLRALTDDDHIFSTRTRLGLELGLAGELGVSKGPFEVTVDVTGKFSGEVVQHQVVRDALMAQDPMLPPTGFPQRMRPVTALTIRPRQTAGITFTGLKAALHFYLDLGFFGEISFTKEFFNVGGGPIAQYDSDKSKSAADEQYIFRLGTGATAGKPMTQPIVLSHLPGASEFNTFPQDVAACLADDTPLPEPPPPCDPTLDDGAPPRIDMCLYGPSALFQEELFGTFLPNGVCSNTQGWLATLNLTGGQKLCLTKYLGLLCTPVSKQQVWQGTSVVSRVWNLEPAINDAVLDIVKNECAPAFVGPDADPNDPQVHGTLQKIAEGMVSAGPCRSDGTLIPDSAIIEAVDPTKSPAPKPGKACHP